MNEEALQYLPIGSIDPDPDQPRREMEAPDELNEARTLAGLSDSIQRLGMLQPIRVRAVEGGRYVIVTGERRYLAAKMAGLDQVPVIVTAQQNLLLEQLTENVQRKAMTPLELADAIQQMLEQGWQQIEISRQLGLNRVVEPIPCRFLMLIL
jgi:ParB family chromosome partitioning protein